MFFVEQHTTGSRQLQIHWHHPEFRHFPLICWEVWDKLSERGCKRGCFSKVLRRGSENFCKLHIWSFSILRYFENFLHRYKKASHFIFLTSDAFWLNVDCNPPHTAAFSFHPLMRSTCQTWSPPTSQTWTQMWFHIRLKLFSVLPSSSGRRGWEPRTQRWTRQSTAEAPTDGRSILGHGSNSGFNKEKYPPSKLPIKSAHDKK